PRILFETFLSIESGEPNLEITEAGDDEDIDGLKYLEGWDLFDINKTAQKATMSAHADGGVPCVDIKLTKADEYHLGVLLYFFEFACADSGYMAGINPFDQPGVEAYKKRMFELLGKPGYRDSVLSQD
ncbi:MAG TPA: glucose-6-phosphate isomerase, partial [Firmicutes bacterium]|nr:glucose-6-phosphate isomerase [Bacillota bacterium]